MKLLTVRVAAERLGVAYSTLKQWIYHGSVRTTRTTGGHHRVTEAEIERLLARRDGGAPATPSKTIAGGSRRESGSRGSRRQSPPATTGLIVALSGRNRLRGFVEEVRTDGLLGQIRLRIGDQILTAVITGDAVQELKLKRGDDAVAIIKSTDVMIAREATDAPAGSPRKKRR